MGVKNTLKHIALILTICLLLFSCDMLEGDETSSSASFQWLTDAGAPSGSLGSDGDWYLNKTTNELYEKKSGSWGSALAVISNLNGLTFTWLGGYQEAPDDVEALEAYLNRGNSHVYLYTDEAWLDITAISDSGSGSASVSEAVVPGSFLVLNHNLGSSAAFESAYVIGGQVYDASGYYDIHGSLDFVQSSEFDFHSDINRNDPNVIALPDGGFALVQKKNDGSGNIDFFDSNGLVDFGKASSGSLSFGSSIGSSLYAFLSKGNILINYSDGSNTYRAGFDAVTGSDAFSSNPMNYESNATSYHNGCDLDKGFFMISDYSSTNSGFSLFSSDAASQDGPYGPFSDGGSYDVRFYDAFQVTDGSVAVAYRDSGTGTGVYYACVSIEGDNKGSFASSEIQVSSNGVSSGMVRMPSGETLYLWMEGSSPFTLKMTILDSLSGLSLQSPVVLCSDTYKSNFNIVFIDADHFGVFYNIDDGSNSEVRFEIFDLTGSSQQIWTIYNGTNLIADGMPLQLDVDVLENGSVVLAYKLANPINLLFYRILERPEIELEVVDNNTARLWNRTGTTLNLKLKAFF